MIYLKNGHSITIGNAGALASRTHVSYADVSGATLDGSSAIVTSSATTYNVATYAAAGTRNVRLVTVSNDGASAGVFTISHNTGATTAPIGKALLQPGQVLVYSENGGVQVSSAESSTLATLTLPATPNPTVPSDSYGTIFIKKIGGRIMAAQIGPSGLDTTLQANLGGNKVAMWMPPGGSTTVPGIFGMAALTAVGTATARTVATTNLLSRMTRLGYVSAATAGSLAGAREAVAKFTTGAGPGLGGFFARYRFGISDPAVVAGARMFIANWLEISLYHAIETAFRVLLLLGFSFLLPIGLVSWNSGTEYTNIPIEATLVATSETETLEYHYKRGDIYINSRFVTYLTPDGEVVFKRKEGVVYPRKAILYKN